MRFLLPALILSIPLLCCIGPGDTGAAELLIWLRGGELSPVAETILMDIRLPRVLGALLVGGMLSAGGCATQNLFRNDLGSPHVLGAVNAAALGAVAAMLIFPGNNLMMTFFAFLLTVGVFLLLLIPGRRYDWESSAMILGGVAVNAVCAALTSGALYLADEQLNTLVFWLLGGCWRITWSKLVYLAVIAAAGWAVLWKYRREMDMLLLGDRGASLAGVDLKQVKTVVMLTVALLTAAAVSCCGVIGFVGLAIPHIVRLTGSSRFSLLLPSAVCSGALLLMWADLISRTCFAPAEVPVGILTALGGGPFFFFLLIRRRYRHAGM